MALAKAEERQNRQNHNNQADEIDKTVHGILLHMSRRHFWTDNFSQPAKFLTRQEKLAILPALMPFQAIGATPLFVRPDPHIGSMLTLLRTPA
jgi:hypothetical protein